MSLGSRNVVERWAADRRHRDRIDTITAEWAMQMDIDWLFPAFRSIAGNIGSMRCIVNININVGYHVAVLGFVGGIL